MPPARHLSPLTGVQQLSDVSAQCWYHGPMGLFGPVSISSSGRAPAAARGQQRDNWRREAGEEGMALEDQDGRSWNSGILPQEKEAVGVRVARQGQFGATRTIPRREPVQWPGGTRPGGLGPRVRGQ